MDPAHAAGQSGQWPEPVTGRGEGQSDSSSPKGGSRQGQSDARLLQAVGVREDDESLYRALLEHPDATVDELAGHTGAGAAAVRRGLARLEDLGLAGRVPAVPQRYAPAPPDTAIAALLHARERALEQVAVAAAEFTDRYGAGAPCEATEPGIEVVRGRRAVVRRFLQLQDGARSEMLVFDQPPYATARNTGETRRLRLGVRYRAIYTTAALEAPGGLDGVRRLVAAGEEARVLPSLPTKLAMADGTVALLPLAAEPDRLVAAAAVVRAPTLLAVFELLFSLLWERAVPVVPPAAGCGSELDGTDERLLALLTAGLKDEAIARQLGTSDRTVRRRVRRLMGVLGARTRFQAGLQAARRGWV